MTEEPMLKIRVLHVDDDAFTREVTQTVLTSFGFEAKAVPNAAEFIAALEDFDPHVVLVDLDLGAGPNGVQLIALVERDAPWVGRVIVSSHRSPSLVDPSGSKLTDVSYIVKSDLASSDQLREAIETTLAGETFVVNDDGDLARLTSTQAEVLRMLAAGMSNEAISTERGCSLRGVERIISRTFATLGVNSDDHLNPRVAAISMLTRAQVTVKD